MMASPLAMSNDLRSLNAETRRILLNKEIIAIDQDPLGKAAERVVKTDDYQKCSSARSPATAMPSLFSIRLIRLVISHVSFKELSLPESLQSTRRMGTEDLGSRTKWSGKVASHETKSSFSRNNPFQAFTN